MPPLREGVRGGDQWIGGAIGYPSGRLLEEVAYIAYHFHWPYDEILRMEHGERQWWVTEVAKINQRLNDAITSRSSDQWH